MVVEVGEMVPVVAVAVVVVAVMAVLVVVVFVCVYHAEPMPIQYPLSLQQLEFEHA